MSAFFEPTPFATETHNSSIPQGRSSSRHTAESIVKYLRDYKNINVPDDFVIELLSAHLNVSAAPFTMHHSAVDGIISACTEWKQYLSDQTDFDRLVCYELISMARSHASVFSVHFTEKAGFRLLQTKPAPSYALIVYRDGEVNEVR